MDDGQAFLPSAFSPNGDGRNDNFSFIGAGLRDISMTIFDRWGNKIFESNDAGKTWDGKVNGQNAPDGAYIYTARLTFNDGTQEDLLGHVSVIH